VPDIETLEIIADWKADLDMRFKRAQLRYELCGDNGEEVLALGEEARAFTRLCKVYKGVTR
jgi:hypothetical protein